MSSPAVSEPSELALLWACCGDDCEGHATSAGKISGAVLARRLPWHSKRVRSAHW